MIMRSVSALAFFAAALALAACADDPRYLDPMQDLEVAGDPTMEAAPATASLTLPIALETADDAATRAQMADDFGVDVPYVRLGDLSVEIEWTVKNLSGTDGIARIDVVGANEMFAYVRAAFVDPTDDEAVPPPPLLGDIPIHVPALGVVSGVFREDELREASIDLELITRGNLSPYAALLQTHPDLTEYQPTVPIDPTMPELGTMPVGNPIPIAAFAQLVRFDVAFTADQHMVMEYAIRVRDHRGILHPDLLDAPPDELTAFAPADYAPLIPP
jgi:hypothetical protein